MSETNTIVFNPWTLPRPEVREDEREYEDRRHPGVKVRLRFRELNPFTEGQALRLYGEYFDKWVKPKVLGNGKEPTPQVLPTPVPVLMNEVILDQIVLLQAMQVPLPGQARYGIIEWSGFAANMPDAFREMLRVCRELNGEVGIPALIASIKHAMEKASGDEVKILQGMVLRLTSEQDSGNVETPENTSGEQLSNQLSNSDNLTPNGSSTSQDASPPSPDLFERLERGWVSPASEMTQEPSIPVS